MSVSPCSPGCTCRTSASLLGTLGEKQEGATPITIQHNSVIKFSFFFNATNVNICSMLQMLTFVALKKKENLITELC